MLSLCLLSCHWVHFTMVLILIFCVRVIFIRPSNVFLHLFLNVSIILIFKWIIIINYNGFRSNGLFINGIIKRELSFILLLNFIWTRDHITFEMNIWLDLLCVWHIFLRWMIYCIFIFKLFNFLTILSTVSHFNIGYL